MAARSGKNGTVTVGTTEAEILQWSLDLEAEVFKYGVGGYKAAVGGVIDAKGSFVAVTLPAAVQPGAAVSLVLAEGGTGGKSYSGAAIVKKVGVMVSPDTGEIIKYTVDFEGDGQWTIT